MDLPHMLIYIPSSDYHNTFHLLIQNTKHLNLLYAPLLYCNLQMQSLQYV